MWQFSGGQFPVALRPMGTFFCPSFRAQSTWSSVGDTLRIDWANYGKYELKRIEDRWEGCAMGRPDSWRRMSFERPFTEAEQMIFDSEWSFEWEKGTFNVEFRADGFNHFICSQFPAHAHWDMVPEENKVVIDWAQYGKYELVVDPSNRGMAGHKQGQPTNWRRARLLRQLGAEEASKGLAPHDHAHEHGEGCGH